MVKKSKKSKSRRVSLKKKYKVIPKELKALETRRKAIDELEQKRAERKERAHKRKLALLEDEDDSKLLEDSKKKILMILVMLRRPEIAQIEPFTRILLRSLKPLMSYWRSLMPATLWESLS
ncbi:nuclear GTP-binding protein [Vigna unguiculata]|uniref:Nuclear GTP-binding protein n=1 Tax=Vigna unguiculata TaxID=3917 RepID=A0A4D6NBA6_VIGUN|nr:nuclear GTP-binding protein [Vigna unguiculata]